MANIAMSVLLYGAPIWADAINVKEYERAEMVLVLRKAALRVSKEAVCVLAGIPLMVIVADERKRVCSATRWINPKSGKVLRVRLEERQVTLCKWKERPSGSSKGK